MDLNTLRIAGNAKLATKATAGSNTEELTGSVKGMQNIARAALNSDSYRARKQSQNKDTNATASTHRRKSNGNSQQQKSVFQNYVQSKIEIDHKGKRADPPSNEVRLKNLTQSVD